MAKYSHWVSVAFGVLLVTAAACGKGSDEGTANGSDGPDGGSKDPGSLGQASDVTSIEIVPKTASIESLNQAPAQQAYKLIAHFADGSTISLGSGPQWSASPKPVGALDASGLYTASGALGGHVTITATYKGKKATADLTVKVHVQENPAGAPPAVQTGLGAASAADSAVAWSYPYDATVFPRGLEAPPLMWSTGAAGDVYYVHLTSDTYEYESYTTATPTGFTFAPGTWTAFTESTTGAAKLVVARSAAGQATRLASQTWTIAPASLRGTVYYWANNLGRVMRIKPGAAAPDDFSAATLPPSQMGRDGTTNFTCTMTCHTVSADGSTLISGGDVFGGTYDLLKNAPGFGFGGYPGELPKRSWGNAALTPNGQYVVGNTVWNPKEQNGLFDTKTGALVPGSGIDGQVVTTPAFSPDGKLLAYVDAQSALVVRDFDAASHTFSAPRTVVAPGADPTIAQIGFPTLSPDGAWIMYQRGNALDSRGVCCRQPNCTDGCDYTNRGKLYMVRTTPPYTEVHLAALDGDAYPFAAGDRDRAWSFEPTFAPVASGGYFWAVFTSRRTYGNALVGPRDQVKQLWVAAIDPTAAAGADPSHPAFRLPGQALASLNMRGFWALDPCRQDGQSCASGTECCGGFCDGSGDGGSFVCGSGGACGQAGDRCNQASDCCDAASGTTCINHVCSEGGPR